MRIQQGFRTRVEMIRFNPFPASDDFCHLLITFANNLDPGLTTWLYFSCSTQLCMKTVRIVNVKMPTIQQLLAYFNIY